MYKSVMEIKNRQQSTTATDLDKSAGDSSNKKIGSDDSSKIGGCSNKSAQTSNTNGSDNSVDGSAPNNSGTIGRTANNINPLLSGLLTSASLNNNNNSSAASNNIIRHKHNQPSDIVGTNRNATNGENSNKTNVGFDSIVSDAENLQRLLGVLNPTSVGNSLSNIPPPSFVGGGMYPPPPPMTNPPQNPFSSMSNPFSASSSVANSQNNPPQQPLIPIPPPPSAGFLGSNPHLHHPQSAPNHHPQNNPYSDIFGSLPIVPPPAHSSSTPHHHQLSLLLNAAASASSNSNSAPVPPSNGGMVPPAGTGGKLHHMPPNQHHHQQPSPSSSLLMENLQNSAYNSSSNSSLTGGPTNPGMVPTSSVNQQMVQMFGGVGPNFGLNSALFGPNGINPSSSFTNLVLQQQQQQNAAAFQQQLVAAGLGGAFPHQQQLVATHASTNITNTSSSSSPSSLLGNFSGGPPPPSVTANGLSPGFHNSVSFSGGSTGAGFPPGFLPVPSSVSSATSFFPNTGNSVHPSFAPGYHLNQTPSKRHNPRMLPSPEPSPEGGYIGQHSQGLGGHYQSSYLSRKRTRRN